MLRGSLTGGIASKLITWFNGPTVMTNAANIRVAFWNTRGNGSAPPEAIARVVRNLVDDGASVLGLCEVDVSLLPVIAHALGNVASITPAPVRTRTGRATWDLALIYNREIWEEVEPVRPLEVQLGQGNLKVACQFDLILKRTGEPFRVFVAHWPSRLYGDGHEKRSRAAQRLRMMLESPLASGERVVVMGDFNDEPFGTLEFDLDAVRDLDSVRRSPTQRLFNPFWRELGHSTFDAEARGTYRCEANRKATWYTFDQIVLSHMLVGGRGRLSGAGTQFAAFRESPMPAWSDHAPVFVDLSLDCSTGERG